MKGYVIATKDLVEHKKRVRYMYRDWPNNDQDSGWRFFSGDESDEYVNNPDHLAIYAVSTIAALDPDIAPFVEAPYGSAFEREDPNGAFIVSADHSAT